MSEIHARGSHGVKLLSSWLSLRGRKVVESDVKTFDLIVDGMYAEVKSSQGPYRELGFIGLTDNQFAALESGREFILFVVCNMRAPDALEVIEIRSTDLLKERPKRECHDYWYRSQLEEVRR